MTSEQSEEKIVWIEDTGLEQCCLNNLSLFTQAKVDVIFPGDLFCCKNCGRQCRLVKKENTLFWELIRYIFVC